MIPLETWIAVACLGLCAMFVALMISFYSFLIGPSGKGPDFYIDPSALLFEIVSISGAPGLVLAGIAFAMTKTIRSIHVGSLLSITGAILISGMFGLSTIFHKIPSRFLVMGLDSAYYVFLLAGIGIILIGIYQILRALSQRKPVHDKL
jgi:hypothetical protein